MITRTEKKSINRKLTEEIVLMLHKRHQEGEPIVSLAKEFNVTRATLRKRFVLANLEYRRIFSNKEINRRYFNNIDTELKAYLLGFIAGDGSVKMVNTYGTLSIDIQERDSYILDWAKQEIAPNLKITTVPEKGNQVERKKLTITSYHIVKDLEDKGIIANKSYLPFNFSNVPQNMQRHVIRGLLDADGCVWKNEFNKPRANIVSTSLILLEQIQEWLSVVDIHSTLVLSSSKKTQLYRISVYSKKDIIKLIEYLYKDSKYYLSRKYNKFCCDNTELTSKSKELLAV